VLNNGIYQSVSLTGWMAANPDLLLATNFGAKESVFTKFPKDALNHAEIARAQTHLARRRPKRRSLSALSLMKPSASFWS
jgi:hypothetical protein